MNLGLGKLTHNVRVLYTHIKTTLISSNAPLDFAFDGSIIPYLGTSYFWANGRETAWVASDIAAFPLALLLPISGMTVMKLSRCISIFPWVLTGMSTDKGLLWANGMDISWVDGWEVESWFGLGFLVVPKCRPRVFRFQGLQLVRKLCSIWLVRLLHQRWV